MDLYALPPEEFTAARDAAAKEDKALKQLRRPTVAAWVVNTLVRREGTLLDDLLALGQELAQAQSGRDADALRELGRQRKELVAAVTQTAVELAGRDVTAAVRLEVEQTLEAALADPASGEAVRSGQLTRALQYAGFGGVDLEGAVAPLAPARRSGAEAPASKGAKEGKRVAKLEAAALEAQGALDDAVRKADQVARQLEQTEAALHEAQRAQQDADDAVEQARQALEAAQHESAAAASRRTEARRAHEEAERRAQRTTEAVAAAQRAAEQARAALDAVRRSSG